MKNTGIKIIDATGKSKPCSHPLGERVHTSFGQEYCKKCGRNIPKNE